MILDFLLMLVERRDCSVEVDLLRRNVFLLEAFVPSRIIVEIGLWSIQVWGNGSSQYQRWATLYRLLWVTPFLLWGRRVNRSFIESQRLVPSQKLTLSRTHRSDWGCSIHFFFLIKSLLRKILDNVLFLGHFPFLVMSINTRLYRLQSLFIWFNLELSLIRPYHFKYDQSL